VDDVLLYILLKRKNVFEVLPPLIECIVVGFTLPEGGILHIVIAPVELTLAYCFFQPVDASKDTVIALQ